MSLFGEFHVPSRVLALHETLQGQPDVTIEIERVIATENYLTPYFWVSTDDLEAFEAAADRDRSVRDLQRLDEFDEATLYRAEWKENVESIVYAYMTVGAAILEASGQDGEWELRMRFEDREALGRFQEYCSEQDIQFDLVQLYEISQPRSSGQYGLTGKQYEALTTAWEMDYYESPRAVTLEAVADELGITEQSLSDRLRRAYDQLIAHALVVTAPSNDPGAG